MTLKSGNRHSAQLIIIIQVPQDKLITLTIELNRVGWWAYLAVPVHQYLNPTTKNDSLIMTMSKSDSGSDTGIGLKLQNQINISDSSYMRPILRKSKPNKKI